MKLIKMTDFVLSDKIKTQLEMIRYAKFLKQPLTLEMFRGDKALFDGWKMDQVNGYDFLFCNKSYLLVDYLGCLKVEDLTEIVTLTKHAIKQLGV